MAAEMHTEEFMDALRRLPFNISHTALKKREEKGRGGFGVVFRGRWDGFFSDGRKAPTGKQLVAIKEFHVGRPSRESLQELSHESEVMKQLDHPHIVIFHGIVTDSIPYALVMEYMTDGSLYSILHSPRELNWTQRKQIALDIASGLAYLHEGIEIRCGGRRERVRILHRDLKSLNVLLDSNLRAKLTDFGLSKIKNESTSFKTGSVGGTLQWSAPELFDDKETTPKTDIYAYGMVLWELAARRTPFHEKTAAYIISKVLRGERETIPADCLPEMRDLIQMCWDGDPAQRSDVFVVRERLAAMLVADASLSPSTGYIDNFETQDSGYRPNVDTVTPRIASLPTVPPETLLVPHPLPVAPLPEALQHLLRLVAEGEQDQAEEMLRVNPELALASGRVTDLSKRTFANITAFQYALWAMDWHMWKMILKYLPPDIAAQQLAELEANSTEHGTHFSFTPLIQALDTYLKNYDAWNKAQNWKALRDAWCKGVGGQQKLLVVHGINEYCRPDRSFDPIPSFTEATLLRTRQCHVNKADDEFFSVIYEGQKIGGSFAILRGDLAGAAAAVNGLHIPQSVGGKIQFKIYKLEQIFIDLDSLQNLSNVRRHQLEELASQLSQDLGVTPPPYKAVVELLCLVAQGEQDQAEEMLRANPRLALGSCCITDLSKRTFANITAFQYALWAMDWHMWRMILKYLPQKVAAQQLAELEAHSTEHGTHFNLTPLIQALNTYIKKLDVWDWPKKNQYWCQVVGRAQQLLPVHVVNEYCRPDRSFDPIPSFREATLPRSRAFRSYYRKFLLANDWFFREGSFAGEASFAIVRGSAKQAGLGGQGVVWAQGKLLYVPVESDFKSLHKLSSVRTQQWEELKAELSPYLPAVPVVIDLLARALSPRPAPAAVLPKAPIPAGLFGRRPAASAESPELLRLLCLVAEGEQDQAEAMLQTNPKLAWGSGHVTDLSERTFANITAFQYALWAMDWHMWRMILKYLPPDVAAQQLAELEVNSTEHGTHFSFMPLIQALDMYVKNWEVWHKAQNRKAIEQAWCKGVGGQQKLLVAHGINEYCRPDRSFDPTPTFLEPTLPRTRKGYVNKEDDDVLSVVYNGGKIGESFALCVCGREGWGGVIGGERGGGLLYTPCNHKSLQKLSDVRTQQLEELKAELSQYLPVALRAAPAIPPHSAPKAVLSRGSR